MIKLIECGCCGSYHPAQWFGDCRNDRYRIDAPELLGDDGEDYEIVYEDDPDAEVTAEQFFKGATLWSPGVIRKDADVDALEETLDRYHARYATEYGS